MADSRFRYDDAILCANVFSDRRLVNLETRTAAVQVHFWDNDIVRVRTIRPGVKVRPTPAIAGSPASSVDLRIDDGREDSLAICSDKLGFRTPVSQLALEFFRPDGGSFCIDSTPGPVRFRKRAIMARKSLRTGEHIFGLGEAMGPIDRRGRIIDMWNTDVCPHTPSTNPMYKSIPFLIGVKGGRAHGVFFNNIFRSRFDVGKTEPDTLIYTADGGELDYFVFAGPSLAEVLEQYTRVTGRPALFPRWSLGYQQSRYSYVSEAEVRSLAKEFRQRGIPCDAIYLDIHYMDRYRVFTFDPEHFPDPKGMIKDLGDTGFKVIPIVDPGINADETYSPYKEARDQGFFVTYPNGEEFRGSVWPGVCAFPDFYRPEVQKWWGECLSFYADKGVAGIWNDMNEPAVFDTPSRTVPEHVLHGSEQDPVEHAEIHNVYGLLMCKATAEGLSALQSHRRPFILTRAAFAGIQRYAAVWTGDNSSWWEHLQQTIPMCLNLGLSGVPMVGADVGGFLFDSEPELLARWTQLGAFTPLFRNHSSIGTVPQEPWAFGPEIEEICKKYIRLRYQLVPYFYHLALLSHANGSPIMKPLFWDHLDDEDACRISNEFMVGDFLVAPVVGPGERCRMVYLPPGTWFDLWSGAKLDGGRYLVASAPLDSMPVYVAGGSIVPFFETLNFVDEQRGAIRLLDIYNDPWVSGIRESAGFAAPGDPLHLALELWTDDGISDPGQAPKARARFLVTAGTLEPAGSLEPGSAGRTGMRLRTEILDATSSDPDGANPARDDKPDSDPAALAAWPVKWVRLKSDKAPARVLVDGEEVPQLELTADSPEMDDTGIGPSSRGLTERGWIYRPAESSLIIFVDSKVGTLELDVEWDSVNLP